MGDPASASSGRAGLPGPLANALPARALRAQLHAVTCNDAPSWAVFLPPRARAAADLLGTTAPLIVVDPSRAASSGGGRRWWSGNVWALSRDPRGCRQIQAAFDDAAKDEALAAELAEELQGHINSAIHCPHANYVVQKCITALEPKHAQFVVDEIVSRGPGSVGQAARHKYGCRIIQRLFEVMPAEQVHRLGEGLLVNSLATCSHPYGNYTMQHLMVYGSPAQRSRLTRALAQRAAKVGADVYACAVVGKALGFADADDRLTLACALLAVPGLLTSMSRTRHGEAAAKLAVQVLAGSEHAAAAAWELEGVADARRSQGSSDSSGGRSGREVSAAQPSA